MRHASSRNMSVTINLSKSAPHFTANSRPHSISLLPSSPPNSQTVAFKYLSAPLSVRCRNKDPRPRDPLATYANKPLQVDAVAAARCGWINDGKDRLVCGDCNVSWVLVGRDSMTEAAGKKVGLRRV
ncbi:hypothetical protein EDD16DRAFT_1636883 [Pisolithus croceorrhizus]|nr:hypothetical protein EDD16DRAFT_1636883 [Pisolithus croceorrhizus]KAI6165572.1 hypothetical protein EDD17DRAFT_173539 [Pisolithus thermaeus]